MTDSGNEGVSGASLPGREYHHALRGPRHAWWRPPLALALGFGLALAFMLALLGTLYFLVRLTGPASARTALVDETTPFGFLAVTLGLAMLTPAALLATRLAHGKGSGRLSSVAGHFRWRWFLQCMAVLVPVFIAYLAVDLLLDPPEDGRYPQWTLMLPIVLVGVPFQAAGEEYLLRGLLLQNVGAMFASPRLAAVVASLASVLLFAAAHGSLDVWIFIDMAIFGAACVVLALRTGGLEASIALHATNNVVGMGGTLLFGGWLEGFVDADSVGHPLDPAMTLVVSALVVPLLVRMAERRGIARTATGLDGRRAATAAPDPRASVAP